VSSRTPVCRTAKPISSSRLPGSASARAVYRPQNFPSVWKRIDGLIAAGRFRATVEVRTELKRAQPDIMAKGAWGRTNGSIFVPVDIDIQNALKEILDRFPKLVGAGTSSAADPFVIALAKVRGLTVVTEERHGSATKPAHPRRLRRIQRAGHLGRGPYRRREVGHLIRAGDVARARRIPRRFPQAAQVE
jgi:uncharacterized protein DUF4411